ncbi:choice-of-anchor I family protein [uncultured Shewanella sp.]|uniref:choice-of-anchor I family protein n=1 Tax=uncultured Shewanella sp. TaxID=173975 RepID=UPI0026083EE1|nr:choice-of-anchor I family protein [uncultured Shewanella sp.]
MKSLRLILLTLLSSLLLMACEDGTEDKVISNESNVSLSALAPVTSQVSSIGLCDDKLIVDDDNCSHSSRLSMQLIARYASNAFGVSAAEIVDFHPETSQLFVINAQSGKVDILDGTLLVTAEPVGHEASLVLNNMVKVDEIDIENDVGLLHLGGVNSLAIYQDLLAVAIERGDSQGNGKQGKGLVAFYRVMEEGGRQFIHAVEVGYLPDNIVFTPNGAQLLIANEGEPNDDYSVDPVGSISVIDILDNTPATQATHIDFTDFNQGEVRYNELSNLIKINGPNSSVAQDLEPEYISISENSQMAYVSLQENNAIAKVNLLSMTIESIWPLGLKDFGVAGNEIDASDKDEGINIQPYLGVYGLYQPDTIASYRWNNADFIVSANEGDARDYEGFSEEVRAEGLTLTAEHPQYLAAQDKTQLGRLKVTRSMGDEQGDGDYEQLISFGGRSFSIWDQNGVLVFDSGSDFVRITAAVLGQHFNNNNDQNKGDSRSDDKGVEPEALALGQIGHRHYAFVGLERVGGIMIYDVTNPFDVFFVDYVINRDMSIDFSIDKKDIDGKKIEGDPSVVGDLGPEGMRFISADKSPSGEALLIVANEVSGSTSVYQLTE